VRSVIEAYGSERVTVVSRSPETATDTASTESAMIEFALNHEFEYMVLIQATSPLLSSEDLKSGLLQYRIKDADSLLSVVRQRRFIWQPGEDGFVFPENYDPLIRPRRQEFNGFLVENGAFYICSRRLLLDTGSRLAGRITAYIMPEDTYHELDEPTDWPIVERLIKCRAMRRR
jgi:N-acylneuraminate cytidylyltransferase